MNALQDLITIDIVLTRMFDQNCYIVGRVDREDVVVFDPGFDTTALRAALGQRTVAAILLTHGHCDHIAGVRELKSAFPHAPIVISRLDAKMLTDAQANLSAPFGVPFTAPPADRCLEPLEAVDYAGLLWVVRWVPGHSTGSLVFELQQPERSPGVMISGDVLFAGSIGRTDFPGGSEVQLLAGIREQLGNAPPDTQILPGHGPQTTIGHELATNPFLR